MLQFGLQKKLRELPLTGLNCLKINKMSKKILKFDEISKHVQKYRGRKKLVLCHGVFDLLHIGHIKHFEDAKKQGDILIVSITPDKHVNKGPNKPILMKS